MVDLFYRRPQSAMSDRSIASSGVTKFLRAANVPPTLSFDKIVNGKTCFPCRLQDFMNYLNFVEHNSEYLKFYLWYKDYTKRFDALPLSESSLSPNWNYGNNEAPVFRSKNLEDATRYDDDGLASDEYGTGRSHEYSASNSNLMDEKTSRRSSFSFSSHTGNWNEKRTNKSIDIERKGSTRIKKSKGETEILAMMKEAHFDDSAADALLPFTVQPFRKEIAKMSELFLTAGGPLELNISSKDREATVHALQHTTNPTALELVLQASESAMRNHSMPNFTRRVVSNANSDRSKQLNLVGYVLLLLSVAGLIILTLSHKPRAWRVFPALGVAVAVGHIISGVRNFCCRLFVSGFHRNLEPWQAFAADDPRLSKITVAAQSDEEGGQISLADAELPRPVPASISEKGKMIYPGQSTTSSVSSFDAMFHWVEDERTAADNMEKFNKQSGFKHAMEPGVPIVDPSLRKLHWNMFWQIFLSSWLTFAVASAIFVPLPKGNFY